MLVCLCMCCVVVVVVHLSKPGVGWNIFKGIMQLGSKKKEKGSVTGKKYVIRLQIQSLKKGITDRITTLK